MFRFLAALLAMLVSFGSALELRAADSRPAVSSPKYILFLTADGFRSDYVEWYEPVCINHWIKEGTRVLHSTNVFPTLTTPNMTALMTGSLPRTTGIAANSQYVKELDQIVLSPRDNKAETIAETLRKAGWKTAAVNQFMLQNRGVDEYVSVGYEDRRATTDAILGLLKQRKAQFIAAIYGATDHAGHSYGPRSKQLRRAVLEIDDALTTLVIGLKNLGIYEQTLIVFSADHGMSAYASKNASIEPAVALRNAGFRVATSAKELKADTEIVVIANGVRIVYFRDISPERRDEALGLLHHIGGAEVLERKRLDELGCYNNHSGDVIVSPLPGYVMNGAGKSGG